MIVAAEKYLKGMILVTLYISLISDGSTCVVVPAIAFRISQEGEISGDLNGSWEGSIANGEEVLRWLPQHHLWQQFL
jgi:hypothetical protein